MRLARSKETEHGGIMISKETGSHDPAVYLPPAAASVHRSVGARKRIGEVRVQLADWSAALYKKQLVCVV